ncbi:hypothetical protein DCCM_0086 [Desulfocucumis palustris]|uniref:Uncharacterized protein n=1 Tax=Desulfocucumis palustris TaxID=1898651 RepID=A0A2L2X7F8_9FIRM|nr:hypothetical protein DCCM_0086 [Desulfocucumis palustris]
MIIDFFATVSPPLKEIQSLYRESQLRFNVPVVPNQTR